VAKNLRSQHVPLSTYSCDDDVKRVPLKVHLGRLLYNG